MPRKALEVEGVRVRLSGEGLSGARGAAGGSAASDPDGERADRQRAGRIIERYQQRQGNGWLCGQCGEENGANFDICWRCHHDPQDH